MKQKISPAVVGIAVVIVIVFGVFLYLRASSSDSPQQLPPTGDSFKPGYTSPTVESRHQPGAKK